MPAAMPPIGASALTEAVMTPLLSPNETLFEFEYVHAVRFVRRGAGRTG